MSNDGLARPPTTLVRRARKMHRVLAQTYPDAQCELDFSDAFELLIATVLSAQTTDRRVNAVTPALFAAYPDAVTMAAAERADVEELIRSTGFYRAKTANLLGLAAALVDEHDGQVPARLDDLVRLPGVGRKTANVVLGNAFGTPGITVDTHVARLARRFEWITAETAKNPVKAEHAIGMLFERKDWTQLSQRLIWHGRRRCHAKRPACGACPVSHWCPAYGAGPTDPIEAKALVTDEGRA